MQLSKTIKVIVLAAGILISGCATTQKSSIRYLGTSEQAREVSLDLSAITKNRRKQEQLKKLIQQEAERITERKIKQMMETTSLKKRELERERQEIFKNIVKSPPIPLKAPDTILRVLVMPHVDSEGVFHSYEYSYVKVEEGRWILGDYLLSPEKTREVKEKKIITPLKSKK